MAEFLEQLYSCIPDDIELDDENQILWRHFTTAREISAKNPGQDVSKYLRSVVILCDIFEADIRLFVESGNLSKVKLDKRIDFGPVCLMKAYSLLRSSIDLPNLASAMSSIDLGLFVGIPSSRCQLCRAAHLIHERLEELTRQQELKEAQEQDMRMFGSVLNNRELQLQLQNAWKLPHRVIGEVPIEENLSMHTFLMKYLAGKQPVKILDGMTGWAATVKWKYLGYLKRAAGVRTIPIEMGDYTNGGQVRLITLTEYLEELMEGKTVQECGYMAQHQLLDQVPMLKRDTIMPDYCATSDVEEIISNVWLGPAQTLTSLHCDPQPNFLCQVVGRKSVILIPPKDTKYLYPRTDAFANHSQVDIKNADLESYPDFVKAEPILCLLQPGDMLFIPAGWWHAVESLEISISVNYFF